MICLYCEKDVAVEYDKKEHCKCSECGNDIEEFIVKEGFDYMLTLGDTNKLGTVRFLLNKSNRKIAFVCGKKGMFDTKFDYYGAYTIQNIKELTISDRSGLINQISKSNEESATAFIPTIGTENDRHLIGIKIDDINMPGMCINNHDSDIAFRFLSMIELLKEKDKENN